MAGKDEVAYQRKRADRFEALLDLSPDVIFTLSPEGRRILELNPAFEDLFRRDPTDWVGEPFDDLLHPDDLPTALRMYDDALTTGEKRRAELRFRRGDGALLVGDTMGVPQVHEGEVSEIVGFVRDVTDRKRAEDELAARARIETLRRTILEAPQATGDLDRVLEQVTQAAADALGAERCVLLTSTTPGHALEVRTVVDREARSHDLEGMVIDDDQVPNLPAWLTHLSTHKDPLVLRPEDLDGVSAELRATFRARGGGAFLLIPLVAHEGMQGILSIPEDRLEEGITEGVLDMAWEIAPYAGIVVANARCFTDLHIYSHRIERLNGVHKALHEVTMRLVERGPGAGLLDEMLRRAKDLAEADGAWLMLEGTESRPGGLWSTGAVPEAARDLEPGTDAWDHLMHEGARPDPAGGEPQEHLRILDEDLLAVPVGRGDLRGMLVLHGGSTDQVGGGFAADVLKRLAETALVILERHPEAGPKETPRVEAHDRPNRRT